MLANLKNALKQVVKPTEERHVKGYRADLGYALFSYVDERGNFDYEKYRKIQEDGNKRKLDRVWALEDNIKFLAQFVQTKVPSPKFGLCHGTRRGLEQKWFSDALGCEVIGTEISETAKDFPNTIQWDFHNVKPEWINNVDFIYSNSFDHSYDPEKCLNAWMSCIKPGGVCILEHSAEHATKGASMLDPFGAELVQMPYLITKWGKGNFACSDILKAPVTGHDAIDLHFIVVRKF